MDFEKFASALPLSENYSVDYYTRMKEKDMVLETFWDEKEHRLLSTFADPLPKPAANSLFDNTPYSCVSELSLVTEDAKKAIEEHIWWIPYSSISLACSDLESISRDGNDIMCLEHLEPLSLNNGPPLFWFGQLLIPKLRDLKPTVSELDSYLSDEPMTPEEWRELRKGDAGKKLVSRALFGPLLRFFRWYLDSLCQYASHFSLDKLISPVARHQEAYSNSQAYNMEYHHLVPPHASADPEKWKFGDLQYYYPAAAKWKLFALATRFDANLWGKRLRVLGEASLLLSPAWKAEIQTVMARIGLTWSVLESVALVQEHVFRFLDTPAPATAMSLDWDFFARTRPLDGEFRRTYLDNPEEKSTTTTSNSTPTEPSSTTAKSSGNNQLTNGKHEEEEKAAHGEDDVEYVSLPKAMNIYFPGKDFSPAKNWARLSSVANTSWLRWKSTPSIAAALKLHNEFIDPLKERRRNVFELNRGLTVTLSALLLEMTEAGNKSQKLAVARPAPKAARNARVARAVAKKVKEKKKMDEDWTEQNSSSQAPSEVSDSNDSDSEYGEPQRARVAPAVAKKLKEKEKMDEDSTEQTSSLQSMSEVSESEYSDSDYSEPQLLRQSTRVRSQVQHFPAALIQGSSTPHGRRKTKKHLGESPAERKLRKRKNELEEMKLARLATRTVLGLRQSGRLRDKLEASSPTSSLRHSVELSPYQLNGNANFTKNEPMAKRSAKETPVKVGARQKRLHSEMLQEKVNGHVSESEEEETSQVGEKETIEISSSTTSPTDATAAENGAEMDTTGLLNEESSPSPAEEHEQSEGEEDSFSPPPAKRQAPLLEDLPSSDLPVSVESENHGDTENAENGMSMNGVENSPAHPGASEGQVDQNGDLTKKEARKLRKQLKKQRKREEKEAKRNAAELALNQAVTTSNSPNNLPKPKFTVSMKVDKQDATEEVIELDLDSTPAESPATSITSAITTPKPTPASTPKKGTATPTLPALSPSKITKGPAHGWLQSGAMYYTPTQQPPQLLQNTQPVQPIQHAQPSQAHVQISTPPTASPVLSTTSATTSEVASVTSVPTTKPLAVLMAKNVNGVKKKEKPLRWKSSLAPVIPASAPVHHPIAPHTTEKLAPQTTKGTNLPTRTPEVLGPSPSAPMDVDVSAPELSPSTTHASELSNRIEPISESTTTQMDESTVLPSATLLEESANTSKLSLGVVIEKADDQPTETIADTTMEGNVVPDSDANPSLISHTDASTLQEQKDLSQLDILEHPLQDSTVEAAPLEEHSPVPPAQATLEPESSAASSATVMDTSCTLSTDDFPTETMHESPQSVPQTSVEISEPQPAASPSLQSSQEASVSEMSFSEEDEKVERRTIRATSPNSTESLIDASLLALFNAAKQIRMNAAAPDAPAATISRATASTPSTDSRSILLIPRGTPGRYSKAFVLSLYGPQ